MNTTTVAEVCAGLAVVVVLARAVVWCFGLTMLRDIRDALRARNAQ
jgi:hypothetical protein